MKKINWLAVLAFFLIGVSTTLQIVNMVNYYHLSPIQLESTKTTDGVIIRTHPEFIVIVPNYKDNSVLENDSATDFDLTIKVADDDCR